MFFLVDDMPLWLIMINTVGVPFNITMLLLKKIHIVFIKVQRHKKVYCFYKNSFVCIFIVVIMYDFLSSPFCIYIGLMHVFIVSNTCHVKCRALSICNGVILLKKERILHRLVSAVGTREI